MCLEILVCFKIKLKYNNNINNINNKNNNNHNNNDHHSHSIFDTIQFLACGFCATGRKYLFKNNNNIEHRLTVEYEPIALCL